MSLKVFAVATCDLCGKKYEYPPKLIGYDKKYKFSLPKGWHEDYLFDEQCIICDECDLKLRNKVTLKIS